jgi:hypothetical protein
MRRRVFAPSTADGQLVDPRADVWVGVGMWAGTGVGLGEHATRAAHSRKILMRASFEQGPRQARRARLAQASGQRLTPIPVSSVDVIVIVIVDVITPVIVAVHLNGNAPVVVIDTVDDGIHDALRQRQAPVVHGADHAHGGVPVQVHGHDHGGDHVDDHDHDRVNAN